jgi:hypothetical protein
MQYKYMLVNDADKDNIQHNKLFATKQEANAYMLKHKLHLYYLVYDLSTASCVSNICDY